MQQLMLSSVRLSLSLSFSVRAPARPCLRLHSKPSVQELSWTKTFKKHCLSRDVCVQLHTKGKFKVPNWLRGIMGKHRGLKFVSINRKLHKTSFDHVVRTPRTDDTAKVAVMRRTKQGDAFTYTLTPHRGEFNEKAVMSFIQDVAVKGEPNKATVPCLPSSRRARTDAPSMRRARGPRVAKDAGGARRHAAMMLEKYVLDF